MPNITNFMNRVTVQNPVTSFWRGTFQTFFKRLFRIFPESLLKPYLKKKRNHPVFVNMNVVFFLTNICHVYDH